MFVLVKQLIVNTRYNGDVFIMRRRRKKHGTSSCIKMVLRHITLGIFPRCINNPINS